MEKTELTSNKFELPAPTAYEKFLASVYDLYVVGWPNEMEFWHGQAAVEIAGDGAILELACGTGRVAAQLANSGARVVGLDRWSSHLDVGRSKTATLSNVDWIHADMRDFELEEKFSLVIMPGHGFQSLSSAEHQLDCLRRIQHHLTPEGQAIFHLDNAGFDWIASLPKYPNLKFEPAADVIDPETKHRYCQQISWSYEKTTQTAWMNVIWEEFDAGGTRIKSVKSQPTPIHNVFPTEMQHAIELAGLEVVDVYGSFDYAPLTDSSESMIWIARNPR